MNSAPFPECSENSELTHHSTDRASQSCTVRERPGGRTPVVKGLELSIAAEAPEDLVAQTPDLRPRGWRFPAL